MARVPRREVDSRPAAAPDWQRSSLAAAGGGESAPALARPPSSPKQPPGLSSPLRPQPARAALQQQQARAVTNGIAVDVPNGNVDRAWRVLTRKVREEAVLSKAQARGGGGAPSPA